MDFNLGQEEQSKLIKSGEQSVRQFFKEDLILNLQSINTISYSYSSPLFQSNDQKIQEDFTETQIKEIEEYSLEININNNK